MNILCIGDIVGNPGRAAVEGLLQNIKEELRIDFVVANAENAAGGSGLTPRIAKHLFKVGCDVLTLGDHVWDQKELAGYLDETDRVLRPANFPDDVPGRGWCIHEAPSGVKVGVVNLLGRTFMRFGVDCPFRKLKSIVEQIKQQTPVMVVDIHAEATSEKVALGYFVDGEVSAVFGTHTHIQTADEKILPRKTAYITDAGMTGPYDSVIGQTKEDIIKRFLTSMPARFKVAQDDIKLHGVVVNIDEKTGRACGITRLQRLFKPLEQTAEGNEKL